MRVFQYTLPALNISWRASTKCWLRGRKRVRLDDARRDGAIAVHRKSQAMLRIVAAYRLCLALCELRYDLQKRL